MDAAAVLMVGGVVGTLAKVLYKGGMSGRLASWLTFGISTFVVAIWGVSHEDVFVRHMIWDYFVGWADVLLIAGGAFHVIDEAPKTAVGKAMLGTGHSIPPTYEDD